MVVGFAVLQTFLVDRTIEVVSQISSGRAKFSELPERLRALASTQLLESASRQVRLLPDADRLPAVVALGQSLASLNQARISLSPWIAAPPSSNIGPDYVSTLLRAVGVAGNGDPWVQLTAFAKRAGYSGGDLGAVLGSLASDRNSAAHDPDANTSALQVRSLHFTASYIALGFDALLSRAARLIRDADARHLGGEALLHSSVRLRFLDERNGYWAEVTEGAKRAVRRERNREVAVRNAEGRALPQREVVLVRGIDGFPTTWRSMDLA